MKQILACLALYLCTNIAFALELKESDIEGKWLIVKMGTMDVADMNDVWQFKNGKWTVISGGKALRPDAYTLKGDIIDLGHSIIKILKFSSNQMKTKQQSFEYILKKQ